MAITIQELIASDTISQAVDKINFNFDQLLPNGGGPLGPAGPVGPPGPIGGRGERGTEWYEGTDDPNVTPPTTTPLAADYYLQSNGDVWEYTGLTWTNTGINLTGPQGATGSSGGWDFFGNAPYGSYAAAAQNVGYPALMPVASNTITVNNQGVRTFAVGIAGPDDNPAYPFGSPDSSVKISNTLAGTLDASVVSMLVHQRTEATAGIKFMGGALPATLNYEQDDITKLSGISVGTDDTLNISVPKEATSYASISDTVGFNLFTEFRSQNFRSGGGIYFSTGNKTGGSAGGVDNSNFDIALKALSPLGSSSLPQFRFNSIGPNSQAQLLMGGGITFPALPDPIYDGEILAQGRKIRVLSSSELYLNATSDSRLISGGNEVKINPGDLSLVAQGTSTIQISTVSGTLSINGNAGDVEIESDSSVIAQVGNNLVEVDTNGIDLIAGQPTNAPNLKLLSASNGGQVQLGLDVGNTTGRISIGLIGPGLTSNPAIDLNYTQANNVMNLRGNIQYKITGTKSNANAPNQSIFIDADTADYVAGDVIMRHGDPTQFMDTGVAHSAFHDYTNASVYIGKGGEPGPGLQAGLGLFVNRNNSWSQQNANQPTNEAFAVTHNWTKISNNVIWGGGVNNNGRQYITYDPFLTFSPNLQFIPNRPYVNIFIGPTNYNLYTWSQWNLGNIAGTSINWTLEMQPPTSGLYQGQRVTVDIVYFNGLLTLQDQRTTPFPPAFDITTQGNVKLQWKVYDPTTTADVYDQSPTLATSPPANINQVVGRRWVGDFIWNGHGQPIYSGGTANSPSGYSGTAHWALIGQSDGVMMFNK